VDGWVVASGGVVCWVLFAWDITRVDNAFTSICKVMDSSEDDCGSIFAMALPPSFHNSPVVAVDFEMVTLVALW